MRRCLNPVNCHDNLFESRPLFYFEGWHRKSFNFPALLTLCKHGEPGRCRLETLGIQSPIKKIRSDFLLCMSSYSLTRPVASACARACVNLSACKATVRGVKCVLICPFILSTASTAQARKVRGVNVRQSGAILRASHQVTFRCYISP